VYCARAGATLRELCDYREAEPDTANSTLPTVRREREEWGIHGLGCAWEI
jgi:hypothetical protein